jgi:hypothetical protein
MSCNAQSRIVAPFLPDLVEQAGLSVYASEIFR